MQCEHTEIKDGPNIPRLYGSWKSKICKKCGAWHRYDWRDNPEGDWANTPIEDELKEDEYIH